MPDNKEIERFTDDIYSTSAINRPQDFSALDAEDVDDSSQQPSFQNLEEPARFDGEYAPDLKPSRTPPPAPKPALNGVTWDKRRRTTRREVMALNNGEPVSFAIRKMIREFLLILVCVALVVGFFFAKEFVINKLTDNTYGSLSVSSQYKKGYTLKEISPVVDQTSEGYSSLLTIQDWAGLPTTSAAGMIAKNSGKDRTLLAGGMELELEKALPSLTVTRKDNLPNYSMLTQIYDSLKAKRPVMVNCLNQKKDGISYAVVYGINPAKEKIALVRPDGKKQTLSFANFIAATRFEDYKKMPLDIRLEFAFGLRNKNTVFFFTEKEV